jgi:diazepam-binding inhibitor (GABA receptor modulator, acyl-CoA-binding protein)
MVCVTLALRASLTTRSIQPCRDAWDSVKGTSKEDAQKKYVEALLEVRFISISVKPSINIIHFALLCTQILNKTDNEESKKYIAEIEAA